MSSLLRLIRAGGSGLCQLSIFQVILIVVLPFTSSTSHHVLIMRGSACPLEPPTSLCSPAPFHYQTPTASWVGNLSPSHSRQNTLALLQKTFHIAALSCGKFNGKKKSFKTIYPGFDSLLCG